MKCHAEKSQHEQPTVFLRQVWPSISCSGCAHWGCREGLLGFWKERGGFMYSNRSIFCKTLWLFHFSFQLASCSLGSFVITRYIYQSSFAVPAGPPLFSKSSSLVACSMETSEFLMEQLGTWWETGAPDFRWADTVFTCCLVRLWQLRGGVWQHSRFICEESVRMKTEAPCRPPTHALHILTKESHSPGQTVPDTCKDHSSRTLFVPLSLFTLCFFLSPSAT